MILNKALETPLYMQIYTHFKASIMDNTLTAHEKLPSIRELATKYNLSKTTIEKAYNQLLIEGYIDSYPKSGYYVAKLDLVKTKASKLQSKKSTQITYINQNQNPNTFDILTFKKCMQDIMHYQSDTLFTPLQVQGEYTLRHEVRKHLNEERGVFCQTDQVIIAAGIQNQLTTVASLTSKRKVAYLVPLFSRAKHVFTLLNFQLIPCQSIDEMIEDNPDFIYISPSNSYPGGNVLPVNDRLKLIRFAKNHDAYIIEDDYNHIFRYNAALIPSVQGLAKGNHVIYIGSFSRNLLVSMRVSYMVLPNDLLKTYQNHVKLAQTVSKIDQLTLAKFMHDGYYKKHLRKLSHESKKQNEAIQTLIENYDFKDKIIEYTGLESNLHAVFKVKNKAFLNQIKDSASTHAIYIQTFEELPTVFLLPYSSLSALEFKQVLDYLFK